MTGRELIMWILENKLEDSVLFEDGESLGFMSIEKAAVELDVGIATISVMVSLLGTETCKIGDKTYILYKDFEKLAKSKERKNDK